MATYTPADPTDLPPFLLLPLALFWLGRGDGGNKVDGG